MPAKTWSSFVGPASSTKMRLRRPSCPSRRASASRALRGSRADIPDFARWKQLGSGDDGESSAHAERTDHEHDDPESCSSGAAQAWEAGIDGSPAAVHADRPGSGENTDHQPDAPPEESLCPGQGDRAGVGQAGKPDLRHREFRGPTSSGNGRAATESNGPHSTVHIPGQRRALERIAGRGLFLLVRRQRLPVSAPREPIEPVVPNAN